MNLLQAVIYGIVQGITEFLPISSNAHLRLVPEVTGWSDPGAAFTAVIQLGTVLAAIIFFRRDLARALAGFVGSLTDPSRRGSEDARIGWAVFYGTFPIVVLGFLLKHRIETSFRSLWVIAFSFIIMGAIMFFAERHGNRTRKIDSVTPRDGLVVGLWQALAIFPGMSRSGSTISGGLFVNLDHASAARFSFLLGIPSITAAGVFEAFKERKEILSGGALMPTLIATAVSFIVGYASIAWLIGILQKRGVAPFVLYRVALGTILLVLLGSGRLNPERPSAEPVRASAYVSQAHA